MLQKRFFALENTQSIQSEKPSQFKIGVLGVAFSKGQVNDKFLLYIKLFYKECFFFQHNKVSFLLF